MRPDVQVVLCVGEDCEAGALFPGVSEEALKQAPWLQMMARAQDVREALAVCANVEEVWVASSDGVEAINLAAAVKADGPARKVYLVGCEETGSVRSRMHAAGLDGVLSAHDLAQHFERREAARTSFAGGANDEGAPAHGAATGQAGDSPDTGISSADVGGEAFGGAAAAPMLPVLGPLADSARSGFLMTVVSGSGGAGKSTVATLAAHLACQRGLRTALLDADLQFGDLHELAGACARIAIEDVVDDPQVLKRVGGERLVLVAAPQRLETAEAVGGALGVVLDSLLAQFDFVVVNTGGGWDEQRVRLLERSVSALFLVDQRVSSVRACRHALDLCLRCGVATGSFLLAVNRCTRHAPFTSIDVSSALHGAHVAELSDGGAEVEELLGAGMAEVLVASKNALCASIDRLLDEVLPASAALPRCEDERAGAIARLGLAGPPRRETTRRRGRGDARERRRDKHGATSRAFEKTTG